MIDIFNQIGLGLMGFFLVPLAFIIIFLLIANLIQHYE